MAVNLSRACRVSILMTSSRSALTSSHSTFTTYLPLRSLSFFSCSNLTFPRLTNFKHSLSSKSFPLYKNGLRSFCVSADESSTLVQDVVGQVTRDLAGAEVDEPDVSARYLVSQVLGYHKQYDYQQHKDQHLTKQQLEELNRLVACRMARMPLQYIAGNWDFRNITLQVRPPVFIPRPETEQLVELVLQNLPQNVDKNISILEVGPGSGNICLSLLNERDDVFVTALERSRMAVDLTKENAKQLNLTERLEVYELRVDDETSLPDGCSVTKFDVVVSNPPYVLRKDLMSLAPEISVFEDLRALDGGAEGLDVILPILQLAARHLEPGGQVFLEVDPCHPHILPQHLEKHKLPFEVWQIVKDFNDHDRFIILKKTAE